MKKSVLAILKKAETAINSGDKVFFESDPLFLAQRDELAIRELICFEKKKWVNGKTEYSKHQLTVKGYDLLDNAEFWPKLQKAILGSTGRIVAHILSFCLGMAVWELLRPYAGF